MTHHDLSQVTPQNEQRLSDILARQTLVPERLHVGIDIFDASRREVEFSIEGRTRLTHRELGMMSGVFVSRRVLEVDLHRPLPVVEAPTSAGVFSTGCSTEGV